MKQERMLGASVGAEERKMETEQVGRVDGCEEDGGEAV